MVVVETLVAGDGTPGPSAAAVPADKQHGIVLHLDLTVIVQAAGVAARGMH